MHEKNSLAFFNRNALFHAALIPIVQMASNTQNILLSLSQMSRWIIYAFRRIIGL